MMAKPGHLLILLLIVLSGAAPARGEIRPDFDMNRDPEIILRAPIKVFSERLMPLWLQALARPEADMQRMAADAIARAHKFGIPAMEETIPALVAVLTAPSSYPAARLAAAQALIDLDSKESAAQMAASAEKYGTELRQVVEPALAEWNYEPHRAIWQARLTGAEVRHRDLVLAIRCLAVAKDGSCVGALLNLVRDPLRPAAVRSEASRAAGLLQDRDLEAEAGRLLAGATDVPLINRLCAVQLIARHSGAEGMRLLTQLAIDEEPAVAVIALRQLIEIDPHLVLPLASRATQNADAKVRQCGVDVYGLLPDPERVALLADLLDDPHPGVRGSVRESLFVLAKQRELDEPIRRAAMEMLAGVKWRGLEQAALLLGALDHKLAAGRLAELLEFNRPEVGVAAAWSLKKLAVPETLPAMLDKAHRNTGIRRSASSPSGLDDQTAHLFEAFGRMKHAAGEPLMREYIPKDLRMGEMSRSAAIWSLGWLHEGVVDEPLAAQLFQRATDDASGPGNPPEWIAVKSMSAVSIARMKATSQVSPFRKYTRGVTTYGRLGMSIRWALIELTGEQIPEPDPPTTGKTGWFLEPLDN
jgi:HEAT repeat protein